HEVEEVLVDTGGLEHGAVLGEVAAQHAQPALDRVGMGHVADAALFGISVQGLPPVGGREGLGGAHSARGGVEQLDRLGGGLTTADVPVIEPLAQGGSMHAGYVRLQFSGAVQFTEEGGDSA